ncbi:MAG TPA: hypothetical protein VLT83_09230 [Opitutaceae bacterium]|nr:hypothetical protein [Opitutaceae bacterium]
MTPTQRILFGVVASLLLVLGFVRAAESFDPVFLGGQQNAAAGDQLGGPLTFGLS